MRIDAYKNEAWMCQHCNQCSDMSSKLRGWDSVCPVYKQLKYDHYAARGHNIIAMFLTEGLLKYSKELADCLYKCTACAACEEICKPIVAPILEMVGLGASTSIIPRISKIVGLGEMLDPVHSCDIMEAMRADCVDLGIQPESIKKMASFTEKNYNPYGEPHADRLKWAEGLAIPATADTVFFYGCTPAYRRQEMAIATAKILKGAGVEFAVLPDEWCCGSPLLRTGYVDLTEKLIKHNVDLLKSKGVKTIVTSCAGCHRTIKKDWPKFVGDLPFEVLHISEYLEDLIAAGKIKFKHPIGSKVTYHDPCHLGRAMGIYEPPRSVLKAIPGLELVEMYPTKYAAWCCGGGGGVKASNPDLALAIGKEKIPLIKETGASILTSACPFCKTNLLDVVEEAKESIEVKDMTELVAESMEV